MSNKIVDLMSFPNDTTISQGGFHLNGHTNRNQAVLATSPFYPINSQDLIVNSPLCLPYISFKISHKNLVLDQDNNFHLISLSILITFLLDNVWLL